jgi:hypothetical protein
VIGISALLVAAMLQGTAAPPSLRTVDQGTRSEIPTASQVTVRDADAWKTLWHAHTSTRPQPDIDFSREMVIGVFLGTRPSAGFAVEIVAVRVSGEKVTVEYRETMPAADAVSAQVIVSPYHLVAVPSRPGPVTFERK